MAMVVDNEIHIGMSYDKIVISLRGKINKKATIHLSNMLISLTITSSFSIRDVKSIIVSSRRKSISFHWWIWLLTRWRKPNKDGWSKWLILTLQYNIILLRLSWNHFSKTVLIFSLYNNLSTFLKLPWLTTYHIYILFHHTKF